MPKLFAASSSSEELFLLTSLFIEPKGCRFESYKRKGPELRR